MLCIATQAFVAAAHLLSGSPGSNTAPHSPSRFRRRLIVTSFLGGIFYGVIHVFISLSGAKASGSQAIMNLRSLPSLVLSAPQSVILDIMAA